MGNEAGAKRAGSSTPQPLYVRSWKQHGGDDIGHSAMRANLGGLESYSSDALKYVRRQMNCSGKTTFV